MFDSGSTTQIGVYIGRFNPIHKGHQMTLEKMLHNHTSDRSLIVIGSANATLSLRNLFTYKERRNFIQTLYPKAKIAPLADQMADEDWFSSLLDLVHIAFPFHHNINLYCGDLKDVIDFDHKDKVTIHIIDRYKEQVYSATEVRTRIMMAEKRELTGLLDERILDSVYDLGRMRLKALVRGEQDGY
jgi:cytidyltransferase-like protein